MLLVDGKNSLDIFKVLVQILKSKCFDFFGEILTVSRSTFEKDTEPLKDFFKRLGIKLFFDFEEDIKVYSKKQNSELKDYKLWVKLPENYLVVSFDYECLKSTVSHLE